MKADIPVFICRKCEHNLYLAKRDIKKLLKLDCPNCGEEPYELWIFSGFATEKQMNNACD